MKKKKLKFKLINPHELNVMILEILSINERKKNSFFLYFVQFCGVNVARKRK